MLEFIQGKTPPGWTKLDAADLAAIAALTTGGSAVTFNAAGISSPTLAMIAEYNQVSPEQLQAQAGAGHVRNYYAQGELLTAVQQATPAPDAVGSQIPLEFPADPTLGERYNRHMAYPKCRINGISSSAATTFTGTAPTSPQVA